VDVDPLPDALKQQLKAGKVDLEDPATTIALLKLNAVVGVTAFANPDGSLESMGIQCALCHSTVDSSFVPGIGKRLDGTLVREATFCSPTRCLGSHQHLNLSSAQKNDLVEYLKGI
jgi:hypothetical protein